MFLTHFNTALSLKNITQKPVSQSMATLTNILKIAVKTNLEVIQVDMVEISLQNKIIHIKNRLRHASNPF